MDEVMVLKVNYSGETKLITVDSRTNFYDVIEQIKNKWVELGSCKFWVSCLVGDSANICLESHDDLGSLKLMCGLSGVKLVSVGLRVENGGGEISHLGLEEQHNHDCSGGRVPGDGKDSSYKDCDYFGVELGRQPKDCEYFANAQLKSLLSDGWGDIFKGGKGIMFYGSASDFRVALIKYSSKCGFRYNFVKNAPGFLHVLCVYNLEQSCNWFVKARKFEGNKSIYVYSSDVVHTCSFASFIKPSSRLLTPRLIVDLMLPNAQNNPRICAKDIVDAMKIGYRFDVPYWKANRAASVARHTVYGQHLESYDQMFYYCKALEITNPGSKVVFEVEPVSYKFKRVFIALNASIQGFKGCPPMLFVDGTFLKGRSKGILLAAIGKDGNRGLFPLAYALVSAENTDNWAWFLRNVNECVHHESRVSYFSDRNSGLMAAFPLVFRDPVHFFCLYHLIKNLKAKFSTGVSKKNRVKYHSLFNECAYELDKEKLDVKLTEFRMLGGEKTDEFLSELPLEKWAISYAPVLSRFGEMTSNAAESFNSWLLAARSLPVTKLFNWIRSGIGKWFVERRSDSNTWGGSLVPCRQQAWNDMSSTGLKWQINSCPGGMFEVLSNPSTCVDLRSRVCSCHQWEASGFPCKHAIAVIRDVRENVLADVEPYFWTTTYRATYSWDINPVCEALINELKSGSNSPKISAPVLSNPIGRPKANKRIPSHHERPTRRSKTSKCINCGGKGSHDQWTCIVR